MNFALFSQSQILPGFNFQLKSIRFISLVSQYCIHCDCVVVDWDDDVGILQFEVTKPLQKYTTAKSKFRIQMLMYIYSLKRFRFLFNSMDRMDLSKNEERLSPFILSIIWLILV